MQPADFKKLRSGYTTGSCAAAAAKGAVLLLLQGAAPGQVRIATPKGVKLTLDVVEASAGPGYARCAIRKDSGDDPDITNGMLVFAQVSLREQGVDIEGGTGVGRVTRPGLDQPVGAAAINSVPRQMIRDACREAAEACGYRGGFSVVISIPCGEELAAKTFNPRLGVTGGLSVIGTSGIVEPMSAKALVDTIRLELNVLASAGEKAALLSPGNYGEAFARDVLKLNIIKQVLCSNYIGDALNIAVELGFEHILLVGHLGKLVKLGIGITNTHSAQGDGRMETLIACALEAGAGRGTLTSLLSCATTDAALAILSSAGCLAPAMKVLARRIDDTLCRLVPEGVNIGFICFVGTGAGAGIVAASRNAGQLVQHWAVDEVNNECHL